MKRCIVGLVALVVLVVVGHVEAGLVAQWKLDGNGDDSADNHDGTVYGATGTEDRFGNANSAMFFDGSTDYIDVSHHADLTPTNAMTISAWFKASSFNLGSYSWPAIVKKYNDAEVAGYAMEIGQVWEGTPKAGGGVGTGTGNHAPAPFPVETDTWYFHAMVYEYDGTGQSTMTRFFGADFQALQSATTTFDGQLKDSETNLNIGRDNWNTGDLRYFHGIIDDVRIYNEALSSQQINDLYTVPEPSSALLLTAGGVAYACRKAKFRPRLFRFRGRRCRCR